MSNVPVSLFPCTNLFEVLEGSSQSFGTQGTQGLYRWQHSSVSGCVLVAVYPLALCVQVSVPVLFLAGVRIMKFIHKNWYLRVFACGFLDV